MTPSPTLKLASNSEFNRYRTLLSDIEKELFAYRHHFKNKIIFCNCNDSEDSLFVWYFILNFTKFGLKKVVSLTYSPEGNARYLVYEGSSTPEDPMPHKSDIKSTLLEDETGDFRSPFSRSILEMSDIVVTFPPNSLFMEFISQMNEFDKKFIIIGARNYLTNQDLFPLIRDNRIRLGNTQPDKMVINDTDETKRVTGFFRWFTNLEPERTTRNSVILTKKYSADYYTKFDNSNIINVCKTNDIPNDYYGLIAVPPTFLDKWSDLSKPVKNKNVRSLDVTTNDFNIIGLVDSYKNIYSIAQPIIDGQKQNYTRIVIQRKNI